jgi:hypothetical protein
VQVGDPLLDGHAVDVAELVATECREDMSVEIGLITGQGLGFEMGLGAKPPFGPFGNRGLREPRVCPLASNPVGLYRDGEPTRVSLSEEASGSFSS